MPVKIVIWHEAHEASESLMTKIGRRARFVAFHKEWYMVEHGDVTLETALLNDSTTAWIEFTTREDAVMWKLQYGHLIK